MSFLATPVLAAGALLAGFWLWPSNKKEEEVPLTDFRKKKEVVVEKKKNTTGQIQNSVTEYSSVIQELKIFLHKKKLLKK